MNPTDPSLLHSPQRRHGHQGAKPRPKPWIMLVGLLAAPLAAAIVEIVGFTVGTLAWGERPESVSLKDIWLTYQAFGLVLIPFGGLLAFLFRRRAPFDPFTSSIVGMILGALVGYLAVLIVGLPNEDFPGMPATIALGAASGLVGGLTFWLICRLSMLRTDD
jgi:hypothetical protein